MAEALGVAVDNQEPQVVSETPPEGVSQPEPTPAAEPALEQQPPKPDESIYDFDEEAKRAVREASRLARSNAGLQKQLEAARAAIEERDKQIAEARGAQPTTGVDEDNLVDFMGTRVSKPTADYLESLGKQHRTLQAELAQFRQKDLEAEATQYQEELSQRLRTVIPGAVKKLLPGLSEEAQGEAVEDTWRHFTAAWDERATDPQVVFPTDDELRDMIAGAVTQTKEKMRRYGLAQFAANKAAAAAQPPVLGGTPSETAPKAYKDMTPEERERAKLAELGKALKEHVTITG